MAAHRWLLVHDRGGAVRVLRDGRHHSDWPSDRDARQGIVDEVDPADRVMSEDPDGYRRRDRVHRRRGWRQPEIK